MKKLIFVVYVLSAVALWACKEPGTVTVVVHRGGNSGADGVVGANGVAAQEDGARAEPERDESAPPPSVHVNLDVGVADAASDVGILEIKDSAPADFAGELGTDGDSQDDPVAADADGIGGADRDARFRIPLPPGYAWEVTQSWAEHCEECESMFNDWDYCDGFSHMGPCCRHSWDFNLPGVSDLGVPVLAAGNGVVRENYFNAGWGNTIKLDHGGGICTRYAHMLPGSTSHLSRGDEACQGLKLGAIGETGAAEGPHLHFQFEDCDTGVTLDMGFDDGNGVPVCSRGEDRYNHDGVYSALSLTNRTRLECGPSEPKYSGAQLPLGAWYRAACGHLPDCPLALDCARDFSHQFTDQGAIDEETLSAAQYLWKECVVNGKADGALRPNERITRAEALKVPMALFGLLNDCNIPVNFEDVHPGEWYFPIVACALQEGIVSDANALFNPNMEVSWIEAAKFVVESAARAGLIEIQFPQVSHFPQIRHAHWGYKYAETLFAYDAPLSTEVNPDTQISRGYYLRLVAALSPCFCPNVSCERGCSCNQEELACAGGRDAPQMSWEELEEDVVAEVEDEDPEAEVAGNPVGEVEEEVIEEQAEAEMPELDPDASVPEEDAAQQEPVDAGVQQEVVDAAREEEDPEEHDPEEAVPPAEAAPAEVPPVAEVIEDFGDYTLMIRGQHLRVLVMDSQGWNSTFRVNGEELVEVPRERLPAMIRIAYQDPPLEVQSLADRHYGGFSYWAPYNLGFVNFDPPGEPRRSSGYTSHIPNHPVLIRIPH